MSIPRAFASTPSLRLALPEEVDALVAIDDDATELYAQYGLAISLAADHPFVLAERARWQRATELQRAFIAIDDAGQALGFAALDQVDGEPYLDQLAVRTSAMRRGLGRRLLERSIAWAEHAGGRGLWLTTYRHLPFNRPFYERLGFATVPERDAGPGICRHLEEQRRVLPEPAERIIMRRALGA